MMNKLLLLSFLCLSSFAFSQQIKTCQLDEKFSDRFYFYSYKANAKLSDSEPNKKLVASIFSLIENTTTLELTNKEGKSSSNFTQKSIIKSKAYLINPSKCVNDETIIVYIDKDKFNSQFLKFYLTEINLIRDRLSSISNTSINKSYNFLEEEVQKIKLKFNELKFYLPFANSITYKSYDSDLQEVYKLLTKLEISNLSIDEQINSLEQKYLQMDCKSALNEVNSISFLKPSKIQNRRIKKLRLNIEKNCKILQKKDIEEAKGSSVLFNNIEIALSLQTYPVNVSSGVPKINEFNLDSFFATSRFNYFLGISDTGLRLGPHFKYYFLSGAISKEKSSIVFSDSFSEIGLTARYRILRNFLEIEFSFGKSINKITPLADKNGKPFNFTIVSPSLVLGSPNKGLSFSAGFDYISANDSSNYKYITARVGINYNIQFKKLDKNTKKEIKNNYEIKS